MPFAPRLGLSRSALLVGCLTLVGLLLRFYRLGAQSLWVDEVFTVKYAALFRPLTPAAVFENLHGPLHSVALHFWCQLVGTGEAGVRSLSAIVGAATIPLLSWALRPVGGTRVAIAAAALLAVSPFHLWYSQEARNYAFLMFAAVWSTGLFTRAEDEGPGSRSRMILYTIANVLGLLSNLAHLFVIMTHGVARLSKGRGTGPAWRSLAISWLITFCVLSPWVVEFWEERLAPSRALELTPVPQEERLRGDTTAPLAALPFAYFAYSAGFSLGPSLRELHGQITPDLFRPYLGILVIAALGFAIAGWLGAQRFWRLGAKGRTWVILAVLPVICAYGVGLRNLKVFNPRYASSALPAYLTLVAEGALAPRRRGLRTLLAAAVILPIAQSAVGYSTDPRYWKDDARGVATWLRAETRPGDLILVVGADEPFQQYYWRGIRSRDNAVRKVDARDWLGRSREEAHESFRAVAAQHERLFVLYFREYEVDPTGEWRRFLSRDYPPSRKKSWVGAEVWVHEREPR